MCSYLLLKVMNSIFSLFSGDIPVGRQMCVVYYEFLSLFMLPCAHPCDIIDGFGSLTGVESLLYRLQREKKRSKGQRGEFSSATELSAGTPKPRENHAPGEPRETAAPELSKLLIWKGEWTQKRSFKFGYRCQDEVRGEHLRAQCRGDPVRLHP